MHNPSKFQTYCVRKYNIYIVNLSPCTIRRADQNFTDNIHFIKVQRDTCIGVKPRRRPVSRNICITLWDLKFKNRTLETTVVYSPSSASSRGEVNTCNQKIDFKYGISSISLPVPIHTTVVPVIREQVAVLLVFAVFWHLVLVQWKTEENTGYVYVHLRPRAVRPLGTRVHEVRQQYKNRAVTVVSSSVA